MPRGCRSRRGHAFCDVDEGDVLTFSATGLPPGWRSIRDRREIAGTLASDASTRVPGGVYAVTLTAPIPPAPPRRALHDHGGEPGPDRPRRPGGPRRGRPSRRSRARQRRRSDGDAMRVDPMPVAGPLHGRLDLRADGTFTYRPEAGFHGEDSFAYAVVDSDGGRSTATVRLTVASIDPGPSTPPIDPGPSPRPIDTLPRKHTEAPHPRQRGSGDDPRGHAGRRPHHRGRSGRRPPTFAVEVAPASGQVTLRPDGGFTYTPPRIFTAPTVSPCGSPPKPAAPPWSRSRRPSWRSTTPRTPMPTLWRFGRRGRPGAGRGDGSRRRSPGLPPPGRPGERDGRAGRGRILCLHPGNRLQRPRQLHGRGRRRQRRGRARHRGRHGRGEAGSRAAPRGLRPASRRPAPLDAPAMPPAPAHDTGIVADGFVLQAVAAIDPLGSVGRTILAKGAIVAAVNGVDDLHGTAIDIDRPVVLDAGDRIGRLAWGAVRTPAGRSRTLVLGEPLSRPLPRPHPVDGRDRHGPGRPHDRGDPTARRPGHQPAQPDARRRPVGNVRLLGPDGARGRPGSRETAGAASGGVPRPEPVSSPSRWRSCSGMAASCAGR